MPPYVASGTYGCVFAPQVKCNDPALTKINKPRGTRTIGKVFSNVVEASKEYNVQEKLVKSIDPEGEFTTILYGSCDVSKFAKTDKPEKCPHIFQGDPAAPGPPYRQLIYEYGGKSFEHVLSETKPSLTKVKNMLCALYPIFVGVRKLYEHKLIHLDIKPGNLLSFKNNSIAKLIDFGLLQNSENVFESSNDHVLSHPYPFYPPEFKLFFSQGNILKFMKLVNKNFSHDAPIKTVLLQCNVDFGKSLKAAFAHKKTDASKIDSYSLGVVLAYILEWSNLPIHVQPKILKSGKTKKLTQTEHMINRLKTMIFHLCHQDCEKRVNINVATDMYEQIYNEYLQKK
jgi:serine/threonine protein kinase